MTETENQDALEALWEYGDPGLSEERFRRALEGAEGDYRLELSTQLARTFSLRGNFTEAHEALDEVEAKLEGAGPLPRARYMLERGRTFNSSGDKKSARPLFAGAWELAHMARSTGLAVDAAHMLAIVASGTPEAIEWNERGLKLARESQDTKARALIPAMLNNSAWDLHLMGRYDEALNLFTEAQAEWQQRERPEQIQIARWSVGRCLRSLDRHEEALAIQRQLEAEHARAGTEDAYVFEEIAENLTALGQAADAIPYFRRAHDRLSKDAWFVENEPERLAHLKERSDG